MDTNKELSKQDAKVTIAKLFSGDLEVVKKEHLNVILNTPPPESWVKTHPFIKNHRYLPIDKVEFLLKKCFKNYRIEVVESKMMMNSISVTVRVHYLDPSTMQMSFHDGVGACELQTNKDTGSLKLDMSNISKGAVTMALPIAKTIAIKDACDHFGDLFGASLNRKDIIQYVGDTDLLSKYSV